MPAADGIIAALALECQIQIINQAGKSWIEVENFYQGPGQSIVDSTQELVASIRFPLPESGFSWGTAWERVGRRSALILPILNCAGKLQLQSSPGETRINKSVLALGPAGIVPFRARDAESFLVGKSPDPNLFQEAGLIASQEAQPRSNPLRASKEYRLAIIPPLVNQVLLEAYQRCLPEQPIN
jgi:carbon-monoxide dehydrogenase medium subunit